MIPEYGKMWYNDKAIKNILSLSNFVYKYRFTYDMHKDDAVTVHINIGIIKLRVNKQGLYVINTTYTTANSNVITAVEENMVGLTSIQIERAKLARKIYSNVGIPTMTNFKHMVSRKMVSYFPISVADIINAEKIYGPSMESIKGKSTRIKPRPIIKDDIKITSEIYESNSNIELYI